MALALTPTAPTNFNVVQGTSLQIVTTWSQNVQEWKYQIKPVITHYEISYCVSGTANWQSLDPTPYNPSATSPYSFSFKVSETGNYDVRIEAKNAITDQSAEIIQTVVLSIYE
jgi:hypothetical protein